MVLPKTRCWHKPFVRRKLRIEKQKKKTHFRELEKGFTVLDNGRNVAKREDQRSSQKLSVRFVLEGRCHIIEVDQFCCWRFRRFAFPSLGVGKRCH